jgi:hypothetical protein
MVRPLRNQQRGGWYQAMSRGIDRQPIFRMIGTDIILSNCLKITVKTFEHS